jgi:hypothetical protein
MEFTVNQLYSSFEPYLMANKRTENLFCIFLTQTQKISVMKTLKNRTRLYGTDGLWRPALCCFKHTDIERTHIHIVSTCVDRYGKKII